MASNKKNQKPEDEKPEIEGVIDGQEQPNGEDPAAAEETNPEAAESDAPNPASPATHAAEYKTVMRVR